MKIEKTPIEGLLVIGLNSFTDNRGSLLKPFSSSFFEGYDVNLDFKESWFTFSNRNVIRGMHLQTGAHATEKLVSVIKGSVIDVILDLREASPTYGEFFEILLDAKSPRSLYIP